MAETEEIMQEETVLETTKAPAIDYDKLANILDGRMKATEESVLKGYFKEQEMTDEEMAQAIKSFKDKKAAEAAKKESDYTGMQSRLSQMEQDIATANKAVLTAKIENAVILEATKMGIAPKAIPYLTRMADLSSVGDESGNISSEKIANALSKVLDDLPELKPQAQESGFTVIGGGEKENTPQADNDKIKAIFGVK